MCSVQEAFRKVESLVIDSFDFTVSAHGNSKAQKLINGGHDHNEYDYDPSYAYVLFKNR